MVEDREIQRRLAMRTDSPPRYQRGYGAMFLSMSCRHTSDAISISFMAILKSIPRPEHTIEVIRQLISFGNFTFVTRVSIFS